MNRCWVHIVISIVLSSLKNVLASKQGSLATVCPVLGLTDVLNSGAMCVLHMVCCLRLRSDPRWHQSYAHLYSGLRVSWRNTSQWSSQHNMKSGFLFGGPQASHLSLPWREGSQAHAERKGSKCPSTPPSSHISENLVLNCSMHVQSFGPLSVEHRLPPGMKGKEDFQWPGCQCSLLGGVTHPSTPSPRPSGRFGGFQMLLDQDLLKADLIYLLMYAVSGIFSIILSKPKNVWENVRALFFFFPNCFSNSLDGN